MDLELDGKRAIVTGGSRGIGKAIAAQLLAEGVSVSIVARDEPTLTAAAHDLRTAGDGAVVPLVADTSDSASVDVMVTRAAEALGGIDILVNCAARFAGGAPAPKWSNLTDDEFFDEMNVKVLGYLRCARAVAPFMIDQGWGRIINISGLAARSSRNLVGSIRNISAAALTKNLADELGPHGINVTVVHPGSTRTEKTTPEMAERSAGSNTIGRMVDASEVAYVVCFLASPKSVAMTGDPVVVSGGSPHSFYL